MTRIIEGNPWTEKDKELLRNVYPSGSNEEIQNAFPDRTWKAINGAANRYKIRRENASEPWTKIDLEIIKNYYENTDIEDILKMMPNRSLSSVNHKASRMGLRKYEKHKDERTIWTDDKAKEIVESAGYKFINTYIENHHRFFRVVCEKNHETNIPSYNFENGQRCAICSGKYKRSYYEIKKMIFDSGYFLISKEKDYSNTRSRLIIKCDMGHEYQTDATEFKSGKRCMLCYREIMGKSNILSLDVVRKRFRDRGFVIYKNQNYTGMNCELNCYCVKHKEKPLLLTYFQVIHTKITCPYCVIDKRVDKYISSYERLKELLSLKDLRLETNLEDYTNSRIKDDRGKIKFVCEKHKNIGLQEVFIRTVNRQKQEFNLCKICSKDQIRGENHHNWQGGISRISEHLRGVISPWKMDSFKNSNFKCNITGTETNLVIHHIYSFSRIVYETLNSLGLEVKLVNGYTAEELTRIENKCLELHYKYGLGACLNSEIHDLFHNTYSLFEFSAEDYEEFKNGFNNKY